jgi:hypothetical protein
MGVFASRKVGARRLLPQVGTFGAILFVVAMLYPTTGEARMGLPQTEFRKDCVVERVPGRPWIRGVSACRGQIVPRAQAQPLMISGKLGKALAAVLYCRVASVVTEFTLKAPASLPAPSSPQRLTNAASNDVPEWHANGLAPGDDLGLIETFVLGRLPDG